jgi:DNA-binding transcriptional regulator WhiA
VTSTLSADAKDALARDVPAAEHCKAAIRAGLELYGTAPEGGVFRTQRLAVARLFWSLGRERKAHPIRKVQTRRLRRVAVFEIAVAPAEGATARPSARCDRRMELRAGFLACGSLAEPAHGYHLEFVPPTTQLAARLIALLRADGHAPRRSSRKGREVVYFKDIDAIVGVLSAIGAYAAVLHLEDVRALKETKNRIHRLVNTEAANVDRAARAAAVQRDAITFLADAYGFGNLSPPLREIASLRLQHPAETLAQLGSRCRPPVKKSTANGRLAALMRLARGLSESATDRR